MRDGQSLLVMLSTFLAWAALTCTSIAPLGGRPGMARPSLQLLCNLPGGWDYSQGSRGAKQTLPA